MLQTLSKNGDILLSYVPIFVMSNHQQEVEPKPSFNRLEGEWIKVHKFNSKKNLWMCSPYPRWIYKRFSLEGSKELKKLLLSVESNLIIVGNYCKRKRQGFIQKEEQQWRETIEELSFYRCEFLELETDNELAAHLIRATCEANAHIWLEDRQ